VREEVGLVWESDFRWMFASTLLTLFVVPVAYTLLDDLQEKLKTLLKREKK
jgi:hypothetical protein